MSRSIEAATFPCFLRFFLRGGGLVRVTPLELTMVAKSWMGGKSEKIIGSFRLDRFLVNLLLLFLGFGAPWAFWAVLGTTLGLWLFRFCKLYNWLPTATLIHARSLRVLICDCLRLWAIFWELRFMIPWPTPKWLWFAIETADYSS